MRSMERAAGRHLGSLWGDRGKHLLGQLEGEGLLGERRVGARPDQRALERAHVAGEPAARAGRARRSRSSSSASAPAWRRRIASRTARSGGPSSTSRPPSKRPLSGACSRGIAAGGRSAERTTWAPAPSSGLDRVEELLGRALLALEELDVVEQQHVGGAVSLLERRELVVLERGEELAREGLRVGVPDGQPLRAQRAT